MYVLMQTANYHIRSKFARTPEFQEALAGMAWAQDAARGAVGFSRIVLIDPPSAAAAPQGQESK